MAPSWNACWHISAGVLLQALYQVVMGGKHEFWVGRPRTGRRRLRLALTIAPQGLRMSRGGGCLRPVRDHASGPRVLRR